MRERREDLSKRAHKQGKAAQRASDHIGKAPPACRVPDIRRKGGHKPRATAPSASAFRGEPAREGKRAGGRAPRARAEGAGAKGGGGSAIVGERHAGGAKATTTHHKSPTSQH